MKKINSVSLWLTVLLTIGGCDFPAEKEIGSSLSVFNGVRSLQDVKQLADEPEQAILMYQGNYTTENQLCTIDASHSGEVQTVCAIKVSGAWVGKARA